MSEKPIPSLPMILIGNTTIAILSAIGAACIGDNDPLKMASRAGLALCYVAALLAVYSVILKPRYNRRFNEIAELDQKNKNDRELKKYDEYTEQVQEKNNDVYEKRNEPIETELDRIIEFNKHSVAHIYLSIFLIGVGTMLQIYGAT